MTFHITVNLDHQTTSKNRRSVFLGVVVEVRRGSKNDPLRLVSLLRSEWFLTSFPRSGVRRSVSYWSHMSTEANVQVVRSTKKQAASYEATLKVRLPKSVAVELAGNLKRGLPINKELLAWLGTFASNGQELDAEFDFSVPLAPLFGFLGHPSISDLDLNLFHPGSFSAFILPDRFLVEPEEVKDMELEVVHSTPPASQPVASSPDLRAESATLPPPPEAPVSKPSRKRQRKD